MKWPGEGPLDNPRMGLITRKANLCLRQWALSASATGLLERIGWRLSVVKNSRTERFVELPSWWTCSGALRLVHLERMLLVLGFLSSPSRNWGETPEKLPSSFIRLVHEHGGSKEERSYELAWGWLCLAAFVSWGQTGLAQKGRFFLKKRLVEFSISGLVTFFSSCLVTTLKSVLLGHDDPLLLTAP